MVEKRPERIAVLLGGFSSERDVSLKTGKQIAQALADKGYQVKEIDPAFQLVKSLQEFQPDVVFIALHGKFGEDGTIQGLLEILGFPYTGSGVLASALAMNKVMTKKILLSEGIETAPFHVFKKDDLKHKDLAQIAGEIIEHLEFPVVVKPACQGSTIGVSVVRNLREFEAAVACAFQYDEVSFAEQFIEGVEVTASVLGTLNPQVLPLIEIISETGFYDYRAKYSAGLSRHIIPARIRPDVAKEVEAIAVRTYRALNCRHFARIDFIISNDGVPYVLEVNTIPGMTPTSLFPDAAQAAGISFSDLVSRLVEEAWSSKK
ncbi:MAG: D-alanine--D-alanine ligase [Bacillota bacterium]|nr:D-alanine--D-alanine ligase [Bacillota bacterium]